MGLIVIVGFIEYMLLGCFECFELVCCGVDIVNVFFELDWNCSLVCMLYCVCVGFDDFDGLFDVIVLIVKGLKCNGV